MRAKIRTHQVLYVGRINSDFGIDKE